MPKATIYEDAYPKPAKDKIRFPKQFLVSAPTDHVQVAKNRSKHTLRGLVPA